MGELQITTLGGAATTLARVRRGLRGGGPDGARRCGGRTRFLFGRAARDDRERGRVILTEDLADGADLGGVRICNPFSPSGGLTAAARGLLGLAAG